MLDTYITGGAHRLSPEAPVPVLHAHTELYALGGVGNVARNLAAIGVHSVVGSVIGDDPQGGQVQDLITQIPQAQSGLLVDKAGMTTQKTRFMAESKHLLRVDREKPCLLTEDQRQQLLATLCGTTPPHGIVISDYGKGFLNPQFIQSVIQYAHKLKIPVIVDPKGRDYSLYNGATLITPNRDELALATDQPTHTLDECVIAAQRLLGHLEVEGILVTRGGDGMAYVTRDGLIHTLPTKAQSVFDVSGAGDTVVAMIIAALSAGGTLPAAMALATAAAAVVVAKVGTAVATLPEIKAVLNPIEAQPRMSLSIAQDQAALWRSQGLTIGFTNGCFDILHSGHLALLEFAHQQCDKLIVGLNSDTSVQQLKGPTRPINPQDARAQMLSALRTVDGVVIFDEPTPSELIEALAPDVLIKGADYTVDTIAGAQSVMNRGGRVVLCPLVEGQSTTNVVTKIVANSAPTAIL